MATCETAPEIPAEQVETVAVQVSPEVPDVLEGEIVDGSFTVVDPPALVSNHEPVIAVNSGGGTGISTTASEIETRTRLDIYDDTTRTLLSEIVAEIDEIEAEYEGLKAEAKEAKERYETAQARLLQTIKSRATQRVNVAGRIETSDETPSLFSGMDPASDYHEPAEDENWWRSTPIKELVDCGLAERTAELLASQGFDTLGKLSDYVAPTASGYIARFTDIKGIGEKKAEAIEAAFEEFWKRCKEEKDDGTQTPAGTGSEDPVGGDQDANGETPDGEPGPNGEASDVDETDPGDPFGGVELPQDPRAEG